MTIETRVGFMTTSILEEITKEFIKVHGKDTPLEYFIKYQELHNYNQKEVKKNGR